MNEKILNEGNQIHNFIPSFGSGTVINYGSGSASKKVTVPTVPVPQHCLLRNLLNFFETKLSSTPSLYGSHTLHVQNKEWSQTIVRNRLKTTRIREYVSGPLIVTWMIDAENNLVGCLGTIRLCDMRQSALCDTHTKMFEEPEDPTNR